MTQTHVMMANEFEDLFKKNYERLYYHAYDIIHDEDAAKDVVSDVFINVWQRRDTIEQITVLPYLYASVRNRCLDHLKRSKRHVPLLDEVLHEMEAFTEQDWEEHEARIALLRQELARQPERVRRVLHLRFQEQKSNQEVAEIVGISVDGVKKVIQRSFAQMRVLMGKKMLNSVLLFILMSMKW